MDDTLTVKIFADLGHVFDPRTTLSLEGPTPIAAVLATLGIPVPKVSIILVNGRHAETDDLVSPGDTLSLFPPLGGG